MPGTLESEQCIYEGMLIWDRDFHETRIIHLIHKYFLSTYDVPGMVLGLKLNGECNRHDLYPHRAVQGRRRKHSHAQQQPCAGRNRSVVPEKKAGSLSEGAET